MELNYCPHWWQKRDTELKIRKVLKNITYLMKLLNSKNWGLRSEEKGYVLLNSRQRMRLLHLQNSVYRKNDWLWLTFSVESCSVRAGAAITGLFWTKRISCMRWAIRTLAGCTHAIPECLGPSPSHTSNSSFLKTALMAPYERPRLSA